LQRVYFRLEAVQTGVKEREMVMLPCRSIGVLAVIGLALGISACSGTIPVNYTPQNFVRFEASTNIGPFTYAPSKTSEEIVEPAKAVNPGAFNGSAPRRLSIAPNQIQNTAAGQIYLGVNVADLVQRATALELEKTGFNIDDRSPLRLSGEVLEFKADDLGYSVDWTYAVRYVIDQKGDGSILLNETYVAEPKRTGKFGQPADYAPSVNEMILSAYDKFIRDPRVQAIFGRK